MVEFIIQTLENMIITQKQLISLSERKKTALIQRDVSELNGIVGEEARLVKLFGELENQRLEQAELILQAHPSLTFGQLADAVPAESGGKLRSRIDTLKELMAELQEKNKVNEQLLKDSLNFVQHMIGQVAHSGQRHFNYQSPLSPQKTQAGSRAFFDTKA
ncbi:flagellar protein FlgN [Bacillus sp. FJAT-27251]|uniref:flagellar protein FlgN n=1 Tax=Bacillus sp. FJAT-27251 TaxID=1684142 RepID=UPI0006A77A09|nr:flagellar protein FlgN [Bacillus sp. FJAT-27251]